jgi:uncharacterized coiled-coil DUF342 family protein
MKKIKKYPKIEAAWKQSQSENDKADRFWAEAEKLYALANKLHQKGVKASDKSVDIYINAVRKKYGSSVMIDWKTGKITICP